MVNCSNVPKYYCDTIPYVVKVDINYSCDATYENFIDYFDSSLISAKKRTAKEEIFDMYSECVYFSEEENEKLMNSIRKNSIAKKSNIFEYYD